MEHVACDLCGSDDSRLIYSLFDTNYGLPGQFTLVQCRDCDLVYQNPRPSVAEIASFYPTARYHPFQTIYSQETAVPTSTHRKRARLLTQKMGSGNVLDLGCGNGLFLLAMRELGWRCVGLEPNVAAAQHARDILQLDVHTGDIFSLEARSTFDLITLWDVLEHTHAPSNVLQHAHRLLKPPGTLALNVPNWDSFERRLFRERWIALDAPRHLYHFSPKTIRQLLAKCGFDVKILRAQAPVLSLASNVLRRGGDWLLRQGQAKALVRPASGPDTVSPRRRRLIQLVHLLMLPPNAVANALNRGAGMTVIAQKREVPR